MSTQDLSCVTAAITACTACELCQTRKNIVPGQGSPHARIMFIGEAPGADEDRHGRPFIGRAGKLLDQLLTEAGLSRQDVFITNVLKCRPPKNRDPRPEEIDTCWPHLKAQLSTIDPDVVVLVGRFAAHTVAGIDEPMGKCHGRVLIADPGVITPSGCHMLITYHPAAALHDPTRMPTLIEDYRMLKNLLVGV